MRILLIGDIFGEPGRQAVETLVPKLRAEYEPDLVIANGENAARGLGITIKLAQQIFDHGVDGITLGNHSFRQRDILPMLNTHDRIIRPHNLHRSSPGKGLMYLTAADGNEVAVLNLMGQLYLDTAHSPFEGLDELIDQVRARTSVIIVDMHAEATSEKVAMGNHLAGRVSAVVGTHTHVQTSDARILGGSTAYITDLGMTGPHDSVIGVRTDIILKKFRTGLGERFEPATGGVQLEGAVIDIDPSTGRATAIEAIRVPLPA